MKLFIKRVEKDDPSFSRMYSTAAMDEAMEEERVLRGMALELLDGTAHSGFWSATYEKGGFFQIEGLVEEFPTDSLLRVFPRPVNDNDAWTELGRVGPFSHVSVDTTGLFQVWEMIP